MDVTFLDSESITRSSRLAWASTEAVSSEVMAGNACVTHLPSADLDSLGFVSLYFNFLDHLEGFSTRGLVLSPSLSEDSESEKEL